MSEQKLVSVVIPAYNAGRYIAKTIESVLAQSYSRYEVLVADDGSTDNTAEVAGRYGPPVRLLTQANKGPAAARNLALRHATGDYIAFLDADDLWHPEKLATQVRFMEANPEIGICGTRRMDFQDGDTVSWPPLPNVIATHRIDGRTVIVKNRFSTSTVMLRTSVLRQVGEFDESLFGPEDWDLWRRMTRGRLGLHLRVPLTAYRNLHGSVSSNAQRMLENNRKVLQKAFADTPDLECSCKLRALSYLHFDAAQEFRDTSNATAWKHFLISLAIWPFPLGRTCIRPFRRFKTGLSLLREISSGKSRSVESSEGKGDSR